MWILYDQCKNTNSRSQLFCSHTALLQVYLPLWLLFILHLIVSIVMWLLWSIQKKIRYLIWRGDTYMCNEFVVICDISNIPTQFLHFSVCGKRTGVALKTSSCNFSFGFQFLVRIVENEKIGRESMVIADP